MQSFPGILVAKIKPNWMEIGLSDEQYDYFFLQLIELYNKLQIVDISQCFFFNLLLLNNFVSFWQ